MLRACMRCVRTASTLCWVGPRLTRPRAMASRVLQDCAPCVALLLKAGANPGIGTNTGDVPLHAACHAGNLAAIDMLVEGGADANQQNHRGDTPLHYACRAGHVDAVAALIDMKAELNHRGAHGATALLLAMVHHQHEVVKLLVMAGADHRIADDEGMRPFNDTSLEEVLAWLRLPPLSELRKVKSTWRKAVVSPPVPRRPRAQRVTAGGGEVPAQPLSSSSGRSTSGSSSRGASARAASCGEGEAAGAAETPRNAGGRDSDAVGTRAGSSPSLTSPTRRGSHQSPLARSAAADNALRGLRRQQSAYLRRGFTPR